LTINVDIIVAFKLEVFKEPVETVPVFIILSEFTIDTFIIPVPLQL
jgi:hypothetical protein